MISADQSRPWHYRAVLDGVGLPSACIPAAMAPSSRPAEAEVAAPMVEKQVSASLSALFASA